MHAKYASRHALYPVPNVFDCAADIVVARAGRETFVDVRGVFAALVRGDVATREIFVVCPVRDDVVVRAREVVVVARCGVAVVRDTVVRDDAEREPTVLCVPEVLREMLFASRTAASAMPTPTMYAIIKVKILFIPCL